MADVELYNGASLLTAGGAVTATFVVSNTLRAAFGLEPKRIALIVAMIFACGIFAVSGGRLWSDILAVPVNGLLIYSSALGLSVSPVRRKATRAADRRSTTLQPMKPVTEASPIEERVIDKAKGGFFESWI